MNRNEYDSYNSQGNAVSALEAQQNQFNYSTLCRRWKYYLIVLFYVRFHGVNCFNNYCCFIPFVCILSKTTYQIFLVSGNFTRLCTVCTIRFSSISYNAVFSFSFFRPIWWCFYEYITLLSQKVIHPVINFNRLLNLQD